MARDNGDGLAAIAGRIGVLGSVALNIVALAIYLRGRAAAEKQASKKVKKAAAVAPSSGKPPVACDSVINLDHGDPTMFEPFWRGPIGESATLVIPGWQTMSYFSDVGNLCWFLEPSFEREVRRLHRLVGNAAVEGYHVLVGTGSSQLFQAALYALAPPTADTPLSVVSTTPFYSMYPPLTDFLSSGLYRWAGDANTFDGDDYIEVVCSPSNPDGSIREAVLKSKSGKDIHDLAYYWPQWALVKDKEVAQKMSKFMEQSTIGVCKDAQLRAAKVLGAVTDGYEHQLATAAGGDANLLFHYARRKMAHRWSVEVQGAHEAGGAPRE
uniref:Alliinase C-terminal domain-containing protein n=1 Tax=Aegilops tauschii TaxID=37682 RepID=M8C753_AEGTA